MNPKLTKTFSASITLSPLTSGILTLSGVETTSFNEKATYPTPPNKTTIRRAIIIPKTFTLFFGFGFPLTGTIPSSSLVCLIFS